MIAGIGILGIFIGIILILNKATKWWAWFINLDNIWIVIILVVSGALLAWGLVSASKNSGE